MAEEVVKTEEEKKVDTTPPADVPAKEGEVKTEEKKGVLPEKGFFEGDAMEKYVEEMGLDEEEQPVTKPKVELKEGEELCAECPEGKKKIEPSKEGKPFKVIKRKGEDFVIKTEEEYDELAHKGLDYTQKTQTVAEERRNLETREGLFDKRLERVEGPLQQLVNLLGSEKGKELIAKKLGMEEEEELLDVEPEVKKKLNEQDEKINALTDEVKVHRQRSAEQSLEKASVTLNNVVNKAREDYPFEDIPAEEGSEQSVSQKLFAGLISAKVTDDNIKAKLDDNFQKRQLPELVVEAAQDLHKMEEHYRTKFGANSGGGLPAEATIEQITAKFPDQVKSLAQNAVALYLKEQEGNAPTVKSEISVEAKTPSEEKKFKGLDDAFEKAEKSPELEGMMEEIKSLTKAG